MHHVCDDERHEPQLTFDTDGRVTCMKYLNGLLYAGMEDGRLAIYRRDQGLFFPVITMPRMSAGFWSLTTLNRRFFFFQMVLGTSLSQ